MRWIRRAIASIPFAIALALNVLVYADQYNQHIAGYGFLFGGPWSWLLDRDWFFGHMMPHWATNVEDLVVILWGPALLYSLCLYAYMWLIERAIRGSRALLSQIRTP